MGFVKLPNELAEWAWYNDNNTLAVYVRLIFGAAWKDREYKNVHLKRGQIITTIPQIAEQSNLTVQQVRTVIDRLKSTGKITVERTSKFSIITLTEYDCDAVSNSQDNSPTTDKQQSDNSQATDSQQSSNSPPTDKQQSYFIINKKTEDNIDRMSESADAGTPAHEATPAPDNSYESKPKKPKKSAPEKKRYADFVTLTEEEYNKLVEQYGTEAVKWCIQKLDNYKGSIGKKYASDYRTILSWVIASYNEEQAKHNQTAQTIPPGGIKLEQQQAKSRNPFINAVLNGGGDNG